MSSLGITVLKNNVPWGPFTRQQIDEGLLRGDFTRQDLAHAAGVKEWRPLGEVLAHVEESAVLPPVPVPKNEGAVASKAPPIPVQPPSSLPATSMIIAPAFPGGPGSCRAVDDREVVPPATHQSLLQNSLIPASFVARFIAFLIDCAILFVPLILLFALGALILEVSGAWESIDHESRMQEWVLLKRNLTHLFLLVAIGLGWFYVAGLEASRWQATVGKRWMGIKVTDMQGQRIGFLRATGRHAAKYLSALPCFLGFIMALFSSRGLALHDRLAGTRVVKK
jgi:uncharacterized RDD family membrane protein YckC